MDYAALKTEITQDPESLGYAQYVASGADTPIADLLNATTGPGAGPIARSIVPVSDPAMRSMLAYALTQIHGLTDSGKQSFYLTMISTINGIGSVTPGDAHTQQVIGLAIADGVITQALVNAVASRTGSRAEVLFGEGTVITHQDVARALRG